MNLNQKQDYQDVLKQILLDQLADYFDVWNAAGALTRLIAEVQSKLIYYWISPQLVSLGQGRCSKNQTLLEQQPSG